MKQMIKGCIYLLKNGVTHRDLKPSNILIKDGVCKLADFGLSDLVGSRRLTGGTPQYSSPEVLTRGKPSNNLSEIWSLGVVFYQMLHLATPWAEQLRNLDPTAMCEVLRLVSFKLRSDISPKARDFILRCLCYNENERIRWD